MGQILLLYLEDVRDCGLTGGLNFLKVLYPIFLDLVASLYLTLCVSCIYPEKLSCFHVAKTWLEAWCDLM